MLLAVLKYSPNYAKYYAFFSENYAPLCFFCLGLGRSFQIANTLNSTVSLHKQGNSRQRWKTALPKRSSFPECGWRPQRATGVSLHRLPVDLESTCTRVKDYKLVESTPPTGRPRVYMYTVAAKSVNCFEASWRISCLFQHSFAYFPILC